MRPRLAIFGTCILLALLLSCTAKSYRKEADRVAHRILDRKQQKLTDLIGEPDPLNIESTSDTLRNRLIERQGLPVSHEASLGAKNLKRIKHWPWTETYLEEDGPKIDTSYMPDTSTPTVRLSLVQALEVAAYNSREYQTQKENVFQAALRLDLEDHRFENTYTGMFSGLFSHDKSNLPDVTGTEWTGTLGVARRLKNGLQLTTRFGIDAARLMEPNSLSSKSLFGDATVSLPLLRGGGKFVVTEPLTQTERNLIYSIFNYEAFKRDLAVQIASDYLSVLQNLDGIRNAEENYRGLIASARRARRLADAGMLPEIQFDQAIQEELRGRDRWVRAQESYERSLDQFKVRLGLPTDARIELDRDELARLSESAKAILEHQSQREEVQNIPPADAPIELVPPSYENAGPYELPEEVAVDLAFQNRLDLRVAQGNVFDAQRGVTIAANDLLPDLILAGNASWGERRSIGSAGLPDSLRMDWDRGRYQATVDADLPFERTAERNNYRGSFIDLERSARDLQQLEDSIKLDVRNSLRTLLQSREGLQIQAQAVTLAARRVRSTNLFLQAGRAQIRDLLEAQDALLSAQNELTQALVAYRIAELEIQRDMGLLDVDGKGLWKEFNPREIEHES